MAHRGLRRALVAVTVLGSMLIWPHPGPAAAFGIRRQSQLLPGVAVQALNGGGLSLDVGRVAKGAPVRVEVVAAGAVAGGVETTSAVCRRVGGILCVNADFAACRTCTTAFGGIIHDRSLQRSPVDNHAQLWFGPDGTGAGRLGWGAGVEATLTYLVPSPPVLGGLLPSPPPTERVEKVSLGFDAVNRDRGGNSVVLYTPAWAPNTRTPNGGEEAVLAGGGPTIGTDVALTTRERRGGAGSTAIPGDGVVLSGAGSGADRLRAFLSKAADPAAARRSVVLRSSVDRALEESVGGHPVILENGRTVIAGSRDPFATNRHPRTMVGWNPAGDLILATVDGRQPGHSNGVSLVEGADVLRQLGATSGFNLDGGGSSTFVVGGGGRAPQVVNRPSDGNERRVNTILAVVPLDASSVRTAADVPPPPPPAPAGPPPADEASTDGLPARPAAPAPTTTTTPPTTVATTTTAPPPPVTAPPETAPVEVAAPPLPPPVLPSPDRPSTGVASTIAAVALGGAAVTTLRIARRSRRR